MFTWCIVLVLILCVWVVLFTRSSTLTYWDGVVGIALSRLRCIYCAPLNPRYSFACFRCLSCCVGFVFQLLLVAWIWGNDSRCGVLSNSALHVFHVAVIGGLEFSSAAASKVMSGALSLECFAGAVWCGSFIAIGDASLQMAHVVYVRVPKVLCTFYPQVSCAFFQLRSTLLMNTYVLVSLITLFVVVPESILGFGL